jgi:hypothetical protein
LAALTFIIWPEQLIQTSLVKNLENKEILEFFADFMAFDLVVKRFFLV